MFFFLLYLNNALYFSYTSCVLWGILIIVPTESGKKLEFPQTVQSLQSDCLRTSITFPSTFFDIVAETSCCFVFWSFLCRNSLLCKLWLTETLYCRSEVCTLKQVRANPVSRAGCSLCTLTAGGQQTSCDSPFIWWVSRGGLASCGIPQKGNGLSPYCKI